VRGPAKGETGPGRIEGVAGPLPLRR
jgi:hypothetical protein